jgi:excinuclease ABC subunit C
MDPTHLPDFLGRLPTQPGVYLMKNQNGTVIYVGKAKNIRQRVRQYFLSGGDGRAIIPLLVPKIADVETIVVSSEKEALLLENTLIKQHQPTYNALLKDDKTYVALKVNYKHPWPMVQLVRYRGRPEPDGYYFGPYTSAEAAKTTLELIQRLFPLRQCSDQEFARRTRPCILYDMKRCIGPCVYKETKETYNAYVNRVLKFLRGQAPEIVKELYTEMEAYASRLEFEKAKTVLNQIRQIEKTLEGQHVDQPLGGDIDAIGFFREADQVEIVRLLIRQGKLIGARHHPFAHIAEDDMELLSSFLLQCYTTREECPKEILTPFSLSDMGTLSEILTERKTTKVQVYLPQKGNKRALVEMANRNAQTAFFRQRDAKTMRENTLLEMQEKFQLKNYPERIECFDNSSTSGAIPVSAMVAFFEGEKDKKRYRKYKIEQAALSDDYGMMREVLLRRYRRALQENDLPDLVILDGSKGHLNVAAKVFEELNIISVDLISIAKEEGRHDRGLTLEQVFTLHTKTPIPLSRHSPTLFFLQKIRDEAHRFVHTFHRRRYAYETVKTELLNIPGIGPKKSKILLRHFGSLKGVRQATREELSQIKGLSTKNIEALYKFLGKDLLQ